MTSEQILKKYHARIVTESVVKSLLWALVVGSGVAFVVAFITWFTAFNGLWLAIGLGLLFVAAMMPIFYFFVFRATLKKTAQRLDSLGFDERFITMLELDGDDSELARLQRENAVAALNATGKTAAKLLPIICSKILIALAVVIPALSIGMVTVTGLSGAGIIPGASDIGRPPAYERFVAVSFLPEEGGYIEGEPEQLVSPGEFATDVMAVADDGWMFDHWECDAEMLGSFASKDWIRITDDIYAYSDLYLNVELSENLADGTELVFSAVFAQVEEGYDGDNDGDGGGGGGDEADDTPNEGDSSGNPGDDEQEPGDENSQQIPPPGSDPGSGASGKYDNNNQIIDGNTPYRDVYQTYYDEAMRILAEGGTIPPELRAIIEAYFGIIL